MIPIATKSSMMTAAVRKTRSSTGTRAPSRTMIATAKAVSVVIGTAHPFASGPAGAKSR